MKSQDYLLAAKIQLTLVDPWDFVTANGSGPFTARIVQVGLDKGDNIYGLVLELDKPLSYQGQEYRHYVATARHEGKTLEDLRLGKKVGCNLAGLPVERARSGDPFDLSWWRGGSAAIADLSL
jgi:hypothetical protein